MTGQLLTPDTIAAVREAGLHGASCTAIANTLHIPRTAVTKILDDTGITRQRHDQPLIRPRQPVDWMEDALCAQTDAEEFFPEKGGSTRRARRVCARCPVTAECLEYALVNHEVGGVWGGLTYRERRGLQPRRAAA